MQVLLKLQHFRKVAAVQVARRRLAPAEIQPFHLHHALMNRDKPPVANGVKDLVIERNGFVNLSKRLFVGAVRGRRHAKNLDARILSVVVDCAAVRLAGRVVRLIDDHEHEHGRGKPLHAPAVLAGRLCLDRGDNNVCVSP